MTHLHIMKLPYLKICILNQTLKLMNSLYKFKSNFHKVKLCQNWKVEEKVKVILYQNLTIDSKL